MSSRAYASGREKATVPSICNLHWWFHKKHTPLHSILYGVAFEFQFEKQPA